MASVNQSVPVNNARPRLHQRSKSNILTSFMHRRNNSDGSSLTPAEPRPLSVIIPESSLQYDMDFPNFSRPAALGEIQNYAEPISRSPTKPEDRSAVPRSPTKYGFFARNKDDPLQPKKPKKTKSATSLVALLSRPKSSKNLRKLADEQHTNTAKDKENQTPPPSINTQDTSQPPIYAQFSSGALEQQNALLDGNDIFSNASSSSYRSIGPRAKERPKSYHAQYTTTRDVQNTTDKTSGAKNAKGSPSKIQRGLKLFTNGAGVKDKSTPLEPREFVLDPRDIDKHLEAMLDRRNIPENQRYKMRSLADTIKMEFIRQDWAESWGANSAGRPSSHDSNASMNGSQDQDKSRGRNFTLSRNSGKKSDSRSPTKKPKGESTLGRHFRSRSTESLASERPSSSGSNTGSGILSKMKLHQGPMDYVSYMRKVQQPQSVEVGKLHKLRLLLRNETVAWTEEFIRQGGMQEIVALLHRIMEVEWR